jgi:hypothetical protein
MCLQLEKRSKIRAAKPAATKKSESPRYRTNAEVTDLVRHFEDTTLPRDKWTHAAHLVVALDFARRFPAPEGLTRLRAAIKRYNKWTGTPETPTRGYHETITIAWFHLVDHFLEVFDDGRSLAALADALVELYATDELFRHYSRERLLSADARAGWVEPDRLPLPALAAFTKADRAWLVALNEQAARNFEQNRNARPEPATLVATS